MTHVKSYTRKNGKRVKGYDRKSGKKPITKYPFDSKTPKYPLGVKPKKSIEVEGDTYTLVAATKYGVPYPEAKYHLEKLTKQGYSVRFAPRGNWFHLYAKKFKK